MQTSSTQAAKDFAGHFNSHGGSQFLGNNFDTSGAPVYIDSNSDHKLPATICELPIFILSSNFTGRGDELQQIDRAFSTSSGDLPARCIIHGMPGVGKTQLALRYATLAFRRSQYAYVFWVSAASTENLTRDFSKLVDLLHLPGRNTLDQVTKLTRARAWLGDSTVDKGWLVILDNVAQETIAMLRDMLPRSNGGGRLLFTTRTAKIAEGFAATGGLSQLALQPPGIRDAVAMLSTGAVSERDGTGEVSYAEAEQVVLSVGALPLAIDQAASYLRDTGSSAIEILEIYKSEDGYELLEWENDLSRHEEKSVAATFAPALIKIKKTIPDALTLLRVLCFCNPESIPISILTQGCGLLHQKRPWDGPSAPALDKLEAVIDLFSSPMRLSKAIQEVQRLSLASCATGGTERTLRIHDLVQFILRSRLMADAERGLWLEAATSVICEAFDKIDDYRSPRNWNRCGQYVSHIESLEAFAEQYRVTNIGLLDACAWAAIYLGACGVYHKSATWQERIWDKTKVILGIEHPNTLDVMDNLVSTYWKQGRWKEAEDLGIRVIKIITRVLGEEHLSTLTTMGNVALTYGNQGRWKEAEELQLRVLESETRVVGEEHPSTLITMGNLASTYADQGRWKEAEDLEVRVLEIRTRVLSEEHPDTLVSMGNLALTYWDQGRRKEAEELGVRVMETITKVLGEEHPNTLTSINNLACTMKSQGRNDHAFELMKRCVELRKQVLGLDHQYTKTSLAFLRDWEGGEEEVETSSLEEEVGTSSSEEEVETSSLEVGMSSLADLLI